MGVPKIALGLLFFLLVIHGSEIWARHLDDETESFIYDVDNGAFVEETIKLRMPVDRSSCNGIDKYCEVNDDCCTHRCLAFAGKCVT